MSSNPLIPEDFATTDKPSMGDPEFVDGQVRAMLNEVRVALFAAPEGSNPQVAVKDIITKYAKLFDASNADYLQTMTPEAQAVWLQEHELGRNSDPVVALVAATIGRFIDAVVPFAERQIDDDQCKFRIDTAVEDCVAMLLGIENPAD